MHAPPNYMQVYCPGETISGAVKFTLTKAKCYDCIKVDFLGSGHVEWYVSKTHYVGEEKYVHSSLRLWSPQQSNSGSLGPGSYSFQFQFIIPSHVPSSFRYHRMYMSTSAKISYKIEGRAVTGVFQFDHKASIPIFISRLTSISGPNQVKPVREVKRKQVGCLCCAAGDVEFIAKLPRTGFCVTNGDVIPLSVDVQNNSTRVIKMKAKIIQQVTLFVRDYSRISTKTVAKISGEPIQPGTSYTWNPTNWIVPPLPSTLHGSRIVHNDYILKASAIIPKALNLSCNIPLVMGNIPFMAVENLERVLLGAVMKALDQSRNSATTRRDNIDEEQQ